MTELTGEEHYKELLKSPFTKESIEAVILLLKSSLDSFHQSEQIFYRDKSSLQDRPYMICPIIYQVMQSILETTFKYREWNYHIPFLKLDPEWEIKPIFPFSGALVRFQIRKGNCWVSVYLDGYNMLGMMSVPYWEIYPYEDDILRVPFNRENADELIEGIRQAIKFQEEKKG